MSGSPAFKSFTVTPSTFPGSVICNWSFDASFVDLSNVSFITIYANDANVTDTIVDNRKFYVRNLVNDQGLITSTYEIDNLSTDYGYLFTIEVKVNKVYRPTPQNRFAIYTSNSLRYQLPSAPIPPTFRLGQDLDDGFYIKLTDPSNQNINPTVGSLYDGNSRLTGLFVSCNNSEVGLFSVFFDNDASNSLYTEKLRVPVDVSYGVYDIALTSMNAFNMFSDQSEFQSVTVDHTPGEPTSLIVKKYYPSYEEYFDTPSIEVKIIAPEYKGRPPIDYFKVYRTDYNTSLLSSDPSNNNYIFMGDVSASYDVNNNLDSSFSYVDSLDLIPGSYYKYKVFSHSECGQNDGLSLVPTFSNAIVASIYPDQATGLNMWTTSATSLDASWNHSVNFSGIEDNYLLYNLILTDASDSDVAAEDVTTINVNTINNHYSFTGLVAGRKYILRVYAGVYDDEEFLQNFFNTVQPAPLYLSAPYDIQGLTTHIPSNLRIKPDVHNLTFYWDAPSSPSGLTLSGYNVSLYKDSTLVQSASIVNESEYTFYGLTQQSVYNFKVYAKYYVGNDTTNVVYSSISDINSQTLYEPVKIGLNTPIATVNDKKVTLTWTPQYDNLYDASFSIYRRIKDLSNNVVEDFTFITTIFSTDVTNNAFNTYTDVSNQTTYFTFGNRIEYYINAIYKDRVNNYSYLSLTSSTDYCVLYITPLNVSDVRIKPNQINENVPVVTVKWTNPVLPADSGLTFQRSSLIIRDPLEPWIGFNNPENMSETTTEYVINFGYNSRYVRRTFLAEMKIYYMSGQAPVVTSSNVTYFNTHTDPITPVLTVNNVPGLKKGILSWTIDASYDNYTTVSEVHREILDSNGTTIEDSVLLETLENVNTFVDNSTDEGQSENFIFGNTIKYYVKVTYTDLSNNWTDGVVYTYGTLTSTTESIVLYNITPLPTGLKVKPLDRHLTLEWTAPDMNDTGLELLNYYLYLNDTQIVTISDLTNLSYTYNDLSNNVTYALAVRGNYKPLGGTTLIPSVPQSIYGTPHANPAAPTLTASSLQTERNIELDWTIDNAYAHYSTTSKIYRQIKNSDDTEVLDDNELIKTLENVSTFNDTHDASGQSVNFIYGNKITYYVEVIYTDISNSYVNNVYVYDAVTSNSKYVIMYDNTTTPQNLQVLPSDGQLTLSWSAPDNSTNGLTVTSYNLYLDASYVANVDKAYTSYAYNVANGESHTLSVEAVNSAGTVTGITSAPVFITGIAHAEPTVPVLTATEIKGERKVELSWTLDTTYPYYTTKTKIFRQIIDANGLVKQLPSQIQFLENENTYNDIINAGENQSTDFLYGNTMTYYVETTYTDLSNSYLDNVYEYSVRTSVSKSVILYDNASSPTGLTVVPSNNHLTLSWNAPNNENKGLTVTGYNVFLDSSCVASVPSTTTTFEYTVTNGQQYTLSVDSVNSAISFIEDVTVTDITSVVASITGISHTNPADPVLTANEVQGQTKVELSWTLDTTYPYYTTKSKIFRQILDVCGNTLDASALIATLNNASTYDDIDNGTNKSANFIYGNTMTYYVETTYTDNANSHVDGVYIYAAQTSSSKSVILYNNPSSPTALKVLPSNNHLTLSWSPPNNTGKGLTVTGYNVYLGSSLVASLPSTTTTYSYSVTNGQQYTLKVDSVNSAISYLEDVTVTGITSAVASITGISHSDPAVPELTVNEVQGQRKVELSWTLDTSYPHYSTESKIHRKILDACGNTLDASVVIATLMNENTYNDVDNGGNQSSHFVYGNTMTYYVETTYTDLSNSYVNGTYTYANVTSSSKSSVIYDNASSPSVLTVVPSDGRLTISWTPPNNVGKGLTVTGYNVYLDSSFVAFVDHSITSHSYNLTNGQTYLLGVQSVNSAISSVVDETVIGLLSNVQTANGKPYKLATSTIITNSANTNNGVQAGKTVLLKYTIDNSESNCSSVEIYRKISSPSSSVLESFALIDTVNANLVNGDNTYIDTDSVQNSVNFLNGNTMTYYVKLNYSDAVNNYSYVVTSNQDNSIPYDRPTATDLSGNSVTNIACIIPIDLNNGEFSRFKLVLSKNGSDLTTIVAIGLTSGGNGTVLQYSSSSSTVIGNVDVNNVNNAQINGICAANQVKEIECSFPSPVTVVTDVFAFINNSAGSLLTSYPLAGIFLP